MLFAFAMGLIAFMVTAGTLLAPVAMFIVGVAMVVLAIRELDKNKKKNNRRRK